MLRVTRVVGCASDPALADQLHTLQHHDAVEVVRLSGADMARRRLRLRTDRGTELALMLDRDSTLEHGSVLLLEPGRAVVIALDEPQWLVLEAGDPATALELGYTAGNLHWKVRFDGARLAIAVEGPREDYLQRLAPLVERAGIVVHANGARPQAAFGHRHDHDHDHDR